MEVTHLRQVCAVITVTAVRYTYVWRTLEAHKSSKSQRLEAAGWHIGEVVDYQHISGDLSHLEALYYFCLAVPRVNCHTPDTPTSIEWHIYWCLLCCHIQVHLVLSAGIPEALSHPDTPNSSLPMYLECCHTCVHLVLSTQVNCHAEHPQYYALSIIRSIHTYAELDNTFLLTSQVNCSTLVHRARPLTTHVVIP